MSETPKEKLMGKLGAYDQLSGPRTIRLSPAGVEALRAVLDENAKLRAEVEGWKNQAQEIAQSNADHVRWHREMTEKLEKLLALHVPVGGRGVPKRCESCEVPYPCVTRRILDGLEG